VSVDTFVFPPYWRGEMNISKKYQGTCDRAFFGRYSHHVLTSPEPSQPLLGHLSDLIDNFVYPPYWGREIIIIENIKEPVTEHSSAGAPIMY
jgi:hypothetical protein